MLSHLLFSPLITNSTPRLQQFPRQLSVSSSCLHCDFCKDVSHLKFWLGERPTDGSPVRPATGPRKPLEKKRRKENEADYRAISPPSAIKSQHVAEPRRTSARQAHTYVCMYTCICTYMHEGASCSVFRRKRQKKKAQTRTLFPSGCWQGSPSRWSGSTAFGDSISRLKPNQ